MGIAQIFMDYLTPLSLHAGGYEGLFSPARICSYSYSECYLNFSLAPLLRRPAPIYPGHVDLLYLEAQCAGPSSWCSFQSMLGGSVVVRGSWSGVSCAELLESCILVFPLSTAPHTSWAPSEAPPQLHSPALKRAKKRVREWVWDAVWGQVESLCTSVLPFLLFKGPGSTQLREQCKQCSCYKNLILAWL